MIAPYLRKKQRVILLILFLFICTTAVISMGIGYSSLSYDRLIPVLFGEGTFKEQFVLFSIRLPRIAITLLAGMALAISGAILQVVMRNDLADPGVVGINAGAGVAVALFFLFIPIQAASFAYIIPFVAFLGALLTAIMIYILSYNKQTGLQPIRLVLIGIGFATAFSGLMVVLISGADRTKVDFIAKWLAGGIWGLDWAFVLALLPWLIVLVPFILYKAPRLNVLQFNDPVAIGIGVSLDRERLVLLLVAVALAASAVSVTGGIAFVGLMAPHIARALVGPRNELSLPVAMLMGGALLLLADTIGRTLVEPDGLPAGVLVSLIGAPYFVYLLWKKK
ncbi:FecCD family ABC transporter permease [Anoxybacillus sp. D401a]|uniref:FecCD family ABC transporter permease n=1 Tax=Anoxybacillus sp. D401a TaxID=575112 RepID=UPI003D3549B0